MGGTVDAAKQIREALKARGITSKQVGVRSDLYSMGSTLRIRIKDPAVSKATVEEIAREHEDVSRDQWGEILSGGNRFVDVEYTSEALDALAAPHKAAIAALPEDDDFFGHPLVEVAPGFHAIASGGYVRIFQTGADGCGRCVINCWGRDFAARQLGALVAHPKAEG